MALFDQLKERYKQLLNVAIPQTLAGVASSPAINKAAQAVSNPKYNIFAHPMFQELAVKPITEGVPAALRLSPPYIAYKGMTGQPVTPKGYLGDVTKTARMVGAPLLGPGAFIAGGLGYGLGLLSAIKNPPLYTPAEGYGARHGNYIYDKGGWKYLPLESATEAIKTAQTFRGFMPVTQPLLSSAISKYMPAASPLAGRAAQGVANVAEGVGFDLTTGRQVTPGSIAFDFVVGTAIPQFRKTGVQKSSFALTKTEYDRLVESEEILKDAGKYIDEHFYFPSPVARQQAIEQAEAAAKENVNAMAAQRLSDATLKKVGGDIEKTIKALVDLSAQNKLANVPGMGFAQQPPKTPTIDSVMEAIDSEDIKTAKSLYNQIKGNKPTFASLVEEVESYKDISTIEARQFAKEKYGNYKKEVEKFRSFLRIAGEKTSKDTKELFREHIPRNVFGVSSDEVANALGKSETEFMSEITKDLDIASSGRASAATISRLDKNIRKIKSLYDKLDPNYFEIKRNELGQPLSVSIRPTPETVSRIAARERKAAEANVTREYAGWQRALYEEVGVENVKARVKQIGDMMNEATRKAQLAEITPKQKVSILDYLRTPDRVLNKIGLGSQATFLRKQYDSYLQELPKEINRITEWSKQVPEASSQRIFKYLDGQKVELTKNEARVANEIKDYLKVWADRLGLPESKRITNYITHIFERNFIEKEFDPELAKLIQNKVPGSVYDPFTEKRLGAMGYVEDVWRALDAYVKRAVRKVNLDPALERLKEASKDMETSQYNYVKKYTQGINMRPTDLDNLLDNQIKQVFGYRFGQRPTNYLTRAGRQAVYRGTLGLNFGTALRNLTQGVNTYAKLGEKYTVKGYWDLLMNGTEELKKVGVLADDLIQDRNLNVKRQFIQKFDKALFVFFDTAEKINRGSAYYGAKAKALARGLPEDQAIEYGRKIVRDTQFTFGKIDTPVALQSDVAKTLAQFQTYSIKQAEFMAEMVKNKEYAGLIRYGVGSMAILFSVGKLIGLEPKDMIPSFRIGLPPTIQTPVEIGQAVVGAQDQYGNVPEPQERVRNIAESLVPYIPAGVQFKKTLQGLLGVGRGYAETQSGRVKYPVEQSPANIARAGLFGIYNLPESRQYYEQGRSPLSENQSQLFKMASDRQLLYNQIISQRENNNLVEDVKKSLSGDKEVSTDAIQASFDFDEEVHEGFIAGNKFVYMDDYGDVKTIAVEKIKQKQIAQEKELMDAQYGLASDRLKRDNDYKNWAELTQSYVDYLKEYKKELTGEADKIKVQNKIEDIEATLLKYKGYGGFKKAKKFTFKKVAAPKIKQAKVKKVKVKRPTKTVKSLRATQAKIKAPKINLGAKI